MYHKFYLHLFDFSAVSVLIQLQFLFNVMCLNFEWILSHGDNIFSRCMPDAHLQTQKGYF